MQEPTLEGASTASAPANGTGNPQTPHDAVTLPGAHSANLQSPQTQYPPAPEQLQPQPNASSIPATTTNQAMAVPMGAGASPASSPAPTAARGSPHPGQAAAAALPTQPAVHGSPTRVYLNTNVTPHLLEGLKYLAVHEPEKPLKWLSEFLAQKSLEVEGI